MRTSVAQTIGDRPRRKRRLRATLLAAAVLILAAAGSAAAFQALPPGGQVNDDPAAGINPNLGVSSEDPTNADVVGGALTAGGKAVPWAVFRQTEGSDADQIFSRSFAKGAWTTRGVGTVGGRSSAAPKFSGSLNFDQLQDGEAPAIDFAGAGRTVPWATWYEHTTGTGFANNNIFASRFDNTGDANQNKWIFAGQSRGNGGTGPNVPSLNIHTNQDAENPSVAGGSATAGANPGPWITWQETSTVTETGPLNPTQIFVERPIGPGSTNCIGVTPGGSGTAPLGGFCWQQTGVERFGSGTLDPSLNVDPTRNGVEPDIAFAGVGDTVPWVVWYEKDGTHTTVSPLHDNEMVFAAKAVSDSGAGVDGGFHWQAVGNNAQGELDTTGTAPQNFGSCAATATSEGSCSLNANPAADAEDPRVAAGTMNPANATVPWVAWDEDVGGHNAVFVSHLVGTGAAARFVLANNGQPISPAGVDAIRPDITFSGNVPYVTFRTNSGGTSTGVSGHFVNAASPTFVLDESDVPLTPSSTADVREPISSACIATPFNNDGKACQGGALGTPFFLFTNGTSPLSLFADAYQPDAPVTGAASGIGTTSASISGSVNPRGASVSASFEFGTTTAYGQTTPSQKTGPDNAPDSFSAQLTGLAPGTTIHYRAVATTDFGTFVGADQQFTTASQQPPPPGQGTARAGHAKVKGKTAKVRVSCQGDSGATCSVALKMTVVEHLRGHKVLRVTAAAKQRKRTVTVGSAHARLGAGTARTVPISLNGKGKRLLARFRRLTATLKITQSLGSGQTKKVSSQRVTFRAPKHHR